MAWWVGECQSAFALLLFSFLLCFLPFLGPFMGVGVPPTYGFDWLNLG